MLIARDSRSEEVLVTSSLRSAVTTLVWIVDAVGDRPNPNTLADIPVGIAGNLQNPRQVFSARADSG